jgi:hypothetical protein
MRAADDPVIARAGMLWIDQKRERAALGELKRIGNAEHFGGVLGPINTVAGKVPAIGRVAHCAQHLFEIELPHG